MPDNPFELLTKIIMCIAGFVGLMYCGLGVIWMLTGRKR